MTLAPKDTRAQDLPNYDDKAWHHVLLSFNGKQGTLYLDGRAIADQAVKGDLSQNKEPLHIADALNQRHFNGLIDEIRIYNRGLTPAETKQNFGIKTNSLSVQVAGKTITVWAKLKEGWFLKLKTTQVFTESFIWPVYDMDRSSITNAHLLDTRGKMLPVEGKEK